MTGEKSREPIVDLTLLDNKESSTAKYNHTKEELEVSKNAYILYKIRLYNEGNKSGYVSKVKDYIPNGLEFVQALEKNNIWDYDENTNTILTNDNYQPRLLEKYNLGEELDYQDLEVVLKVKEDAEEDLNIVNIARIEEIKYQDGKLAIDNDNQNTFTYPEKIAAYKGGEDTDLSDSYIPGQEDTDDFEKIVILDYDHVDLALRLYISAVSSDNIFEESEYLTGENSREPVVDTQKFDNREDENSPKTATYNHSKAPISVKANDYILYKMRIYNEGNIAGSALEIKDYLPKDLEFVSDLEQNRIWTYDEETHSVVTNDYFEPELLERHYKGQDLDYQEIELVCKVKEDAEEDINIVNIAEIVKCQNEFGIIYQDRDSITAFSVPQDTSNYNGGNNDGNYTSGQEDDDDFDRVIIKSLYGEYDLQIIKTDELGNVISNSITTFNINEEEKETVDGIIKYEGLGINKRNLNEIEVYEITETEVSNNYLKFDGKVKLEIAKKISNDETKYEIDQENTKIVVEDKDGIIQDNQDNAILEIETEEEKEIIKVKIKNYEKVDLALRKYVSAVSIDEKFEQKEYLSRDPKVELKDLDDNTKTTARYNGSKIPVAVRPNDYVLFKIRIYNEGNKSAYASKIKDYLPEGTEFIEGLEQNKIWTYNNETKTITTNSNYEPILIEGHTIGKELKYQELDVVLKVKENITENVKMVNIAEITESKYANGLIAVDKDNENSFIYPNDITKYYGGVDDDKSDNYIPGQEDDDDFDAIIVNTLYGKYTLEIQKTNKAGTIINNLETVFEINEIYELAKNGIVNIKNIEINKENLNEQDIYKVVELKAPTGYKEIDGIIYITVNKKESPDRTKYEPYNIIVELEKTNGEKIKLNNAEVKTQNGETKVIVKIANEEITKTQDNQNNTPKEVISSNISTTSSDTTSQNNRVVTVNSNNSSGGTNNTIKVVSSTNTNTNKETKTNTDSTAKTVSPKTGDNVPEIVFDIIYFVLFINIIIITVEKKYKK